MSFFDTAFPKFFNCFFSFSNESYVTGTEDLTFISLLLFPSLLFLTTDKQVLSAVGASLWFPVCLLTILHVNFYLPVSDQIMSNDYSCIFIALAGFRRSHRISNFDTGIAGSQRKFGNDTCF